MQKEEWNAWDKRHRKQNCEGSGKRTQATNELQHDLRNRTKHFALRIVRMFSKLPKTTEAQVLGKQLLRSGTSIGANYREACRARSKAEFIAKCGDCLREVDETAYWLDLLVESGISTVAKLALLQGEADELTAIFVTILKRAKE